MKHKEKQKKNLTYNQKRRESREPYSKVIQMLELTGNLKKYMTDIFLKIQLRGGQQAGSDG